MKLRSIVKFTLAIVVLAWGCADLQAQRKSTAKTKTTKTKTTTVKKSYPPLSMESLNKKELILANDLGDGDIVLISVDLNFNDLTIYMGGYEYGGTASVSGNTLTLKSGGLLFTLNSPDGGYHFTGTLKDTKRNISSTLEGYIYRPEPGNLSQETSQAFLKGEYTAFLNVVIRKDRPEFFLPVTVSFTKDPEEPNTLSFKVKGTSKIMSILGTIKGEIEFDEEEYSIKSELGADYNNSYGKHNKYTPLFYIGKTNIQGVGNAELYLYFAKKSL